MTPPTPTQLGIVPRTLSEEVAAKRTRRQEGEIRRAQNAADNSNAEIEQVRRTKREICCLAQLEPYEERLRELDAELADCERGSLIEKQLLKDRRLVLVARGRHAHELNLREAC